MRQPVRFQRFRLSGLEITRRASVRLNFVRQHVFFEATLPFRRVAAYIAGKDF